VAAKAVDTWLMRQNKERMSVVLRKHVSGVM